MNIKHFITGIQHIGIPTNDMEATLLFYERLGFRVAYQTVNEAANEKVAFLQLNNLMIETYENKMAAMQSGAIDHLAIDVKEIDSLFETVKANRFQLLDTEVQHLPFWEKGVRFFTIVGPNQEKIEFCEKL